MAHLIGILLILLSFLFLIIRKVTEPVSENTTILFIIWFSGILHYWRSNSRNILTKYGSGPLHMQATGGFLFLYLNMCHAEHGIQSSLII